MKRLPPLNALRAFETAARLGSFTLAGASLHVTQGAVSRQVKLLEEWLDRPLFVRGSQGIVLTPQGRELAAAIEHAFEHIGRSVEQIQQTSRRMTLTINVPPTFATRWLAPRLGDFRRRQPQLDLSITTNFLRHTRDVRAYDCAIVYDDHAWPECDSRLLRRERHVLVASPQLWTDGLPPRLERSTLLHILNGDQRLPLWEHWIDLFGLTHVDPGPGLAFSTLDQAINTAVMGTGVALVDSIMVARELANGALRRLNKLDAEWQYGYWFVDSARDPAAKAVVFAFHEWLQEQLAETRLASEAAGIGRAASDESWGVDEP